MFQFAINHVGLDNNVDPISEEDKQKWSDMDQESISETVNRARSLIREDYNNAIERQLKLK